LNDIKNGKIFLDLLGSVLLISVLKKCVYIQGVIFIMKLDAMSEQKRKPIAGVFSTTFDVGPNAIAYRQNTTVHKPLDQYEWVSRGYGMQC
jgi:hypothetical protein